MVDFISAEMLKKIYKVYGHFYSIDISQSNSLLCRSVLEICTVGYVEDHLLLSSVEPDAVVVMMNPGSSKPEVEFEQIVSHQKLSNFAIRLVPTKPDTTQYQIMRIMHELKWSHVRVINLSDLREPKSEIFYDKVKMLDTKQFDGHSIFSSSRLKELQLKLKRRVDAPIICAWGISSDLDGLISKCQQSILNEKKIVGFLKDGTKDKYFHPLPRSHVEKMNWVEKITKKIF